MRGKADDRKKFFNAVRITPAYAGKSFSSVRSASRSTDHPRLCGEKYDLEDFRKSLCGSPPPMRGKVVRLLDNRKCLGITPAYAGKSGTKSISNSSWWDHPRLCGEKSLTGKRKASQRGSPPPMRGKVNPKNINDYIIGITPAYAGKRAIRFNVGAVPRDHPRLCGEKFPW